MSIKIQVDPARLDSAAGQIEQQTLSYEKNYRRLFQEVAAMGSGWQGKDNQAFVSQKIFSRWRHSCASMRLFSS